jgi:hypothetical protein
MSKQKKSKPNEKEINVDAKAYLEQHIGDGTWTRLQAEIIANWMEEYANQKLYKTETNKTNNNTDEEQKQVEKMRDFLEEAFCVDGGCDFIECIEIKSILKNMKGMLFALADTKRGRFYVTMSK